MSTTSYPTAANGPDLPLRTQALLLDMDGTLIDSGDAVERAWNQLLQELGGGLTFSHAMHGKPARQTLHELYPDVSEEQITAAHRRIEELEIADVAGIEVLPGTQRLLGELDAAAEQLGRPTWTVVTSCTRELFTARWERTGLPEPAHTVTADQVTRGKPDPEPYRVGAERLGVEPAQAVVIEDAVGGLTSGRAAGCPTIAVTSTTPAAELADLAGALITSLDDLEVHVDGKDLLVTRRGG